MSVTRLAVDIGGTFTDVALIHDGVVHIRKVLTTHDAPERGFLDGMATVLKAAKVSPADLGLVLHGTTLATNALIERRGADVALVTTAGFRDVIEIADEGRFDQYDLFIRKPPPLVPREWRFTVAERVGADGRVLVPLEEASLERLCAQIRAAGVSSVAVGLLHAYRNPAHERRVRDALATALPGVSVCISSEVCPEIREYERLSTTCANAYVRPIMEGYLARLERELATMGLRCPLLLMTSGGGLCSVATARRFPIRLVESGPAGGASLASRIATQAGLASVLSFDMGGTTAKICLIQDSRPETARTFEVARSARFKKGSGLPLRIPVIEMIEIGAGGGSIAAVDRLRNITVGPESAESDPGPACYARGGTRPTVTDADVLLGRISPDGFAGGTMQLDVARAATAVEQAVGSVLGLDVTHGAFGICEAVDETMTNAARVYAVERGKDLAAHTMIAFGGAAPLHAARMAEKLHVDRILVPQNAGVGSALGFLCAPIAYESVRSHYMALAAFDAGAINALFETLRAEVDDALAGLLPPGTTLREERLAYMRYAGQGHEIPITLPVRAYGPTDAGAFLDPFMARYRELFGRTLPDAPVEILTLGLKATGPALTSLDGLRTAHAGAAAAGGPLTFRRVYLPDRHGYAEVPVYARDALTGGRPRRGPCIVVEDTTTTFVTTPFDVAVDAHGNLTLSRHAS